MQRSQRRTVAGAGQDQLVTAPEACLKMRQHRADQNPQVRLGDRPENPHRYSLRRRAQVDIRGEVVNRRAIAAIAGGDRVAEPPAHRLGIDGVMAADPNADRHILAADTRRMQPSQDDRQRLADRRPARRVVDHDRHLRARATCLLEPSPSPRVNQAPAPAPRVIRQRTTQVRPNNLDVRPGDWPVGRKCQLERSVRSPRHRDHARRETEPATSPSFHFRG